MRVLLHPPLCFEWAIALVNGGNSYTCFVNPAARQSTVLFYLGTGPQQANDLTTPIQTLRNDRRVGIYWERLYSVVFLLGIGVSR